MQGCLQIYFKIGKQKIQAIASSLSKRTKCKYPEAIHHGLCCTWSTSKEWKEYATKYYGGKLRCHSSWCRCPTPLLYNSRLTVAGKIKGVEVLSVVNAHDMSLIWITTESHVLKKYHTICSIPNGAHLIISSVIFVGGKYEKSSLIHLLQWNIEYWPSRHSTIFP